MFTSEMTYHDLYSELTSAIEEMGKHDLVQCLNDLGMVGDIAQEEASGRGWEFEREVEHSDAMTSVSVSITSFGDEDEDGDEF